MTVTPPSTHTKISTTAWGIPLTNQVNANTDALTPTAWTAVTFQNGWSNFGAGLQVAQYRKIGDVVEVRGVIGGGTSATVAFTLPVGFRPPATIAVPAAAAGNFAMVNVAAAGTVAVTSPSGTSSVSIAFRLSVTA